LLDDLAMAWERKRRQRIDPKDSHLQHLRSCLQLRAINEACAIRDADHARRVRLGDVVDADQRGQLDGGADLLQTFAPRCIGRVLVVVDESTG